MKEAKVAVLVVDDDERLLGAYRRGFQRSCRVHTASDIPTAHAIAEQQELDVAIVDLHLRDSSSLSFIRQLRATRPRVRIVLVSGYLTTEATVLVVKAGADHVFNKPILPSEILKRLDVQPAQDVDRSQTPTLAEACDAHVSRVLADCGWNLSETARRLGIYRSSLQRRLRKTNLRPDC